MPSAMFRSTKCFALRKEYMQMREKASGKGWEKAKGLEVIVRQEEKKAAMTLLCVCKVFTVSERPH